MKAKITLLATIISLCANSVWAKSNELDTIKSRAYVICGTDLSTKSLAYKDDDGNWQGIDADICRNFAAAILGNSEAFKLMNVSLKKAIPYLNDKKIDIMLGNTSLSAGQEAQYSALAIGELYFDKQVFVAREQTSATSMDEYKGEKVCVMANSADYSNLNAYNNKYGMEFKLLQFPDMNAVKQAFYLNRCKLASGSEIYFKGIEGTLVAKNNTTVILPETIAIRPIFAYTSKKNFNMQIAGKWIVNAPKLAEQNKINKNNTEAFISVKDDSVRNLLGFDTALWTSFNLNPSWALQAIKERGNFEEMFEKNLGKESAIDLERGPNNLIENGGLISALPFI